MLISVIIPTFNRTDLLKKCLESLAPANQTIDTDLYEVIVTDDGNASLERERIEKKYSRVRWVKGPAKGPAANRNNGAKYAKGEWLVFIDDDCIPSSDLLIQYYNAIIQHAGCLVFEGAILPDDWEKLKIDLSECPVNTKGGFFWSANICVNKNVFNQINGFDEHFRLAAQEDQDIYKRLLEITKVKFIENAYVIHPVRIRGLLSKLKSTPAELFNWIYFSKKNISWFQLIQMGVKSQFLSLFKKIKLLQLKSIIYHIAVLICFFPTIIFYAIQTRKQ